MMPAILFSVLWTLSWSKQKAMSVYGRDSYYMAATAKADSTGKRRFIRKLVYNALRHTPEGGSILLRLCRDGSRAVLTVADTGEGISAEHLPRIFERFYKVSQERGEKDGSSGLGLYIVKTTVEAMEGSVEVNSTPGEGTVFTLTFPAEDFKE